MEEYRFTYDHYRQRSDSQSERSIRYLPVLPPYRILSKYRANSDAALEETGQLLKDLAAPKVEVPHLSSRVFGGQLRRGSASVKNLRNLISERARMLDRHLREIDERRSEAVNQVSFAKRPYSGRTPQDIARFERLLLQLDKDRRSECLDFWKDMTREKKELLDSAAEYGATRQRARLLSDAQVNSSFALPSEGSGAETDEDSSLLDPQTEYDEPSLAEAEPLYDDWSLPLSEVEEEDE